MIELELRRRVYETTIDRIGLALGAAGLIGGIVAGALVAASGRGSPAGLIVATMVGAMLSASSITALAGPVWVAMHAAGRRGPADAALVGALTGFIVSLLAQSFGLGLFDVAVASDSRTLSFRWASAALTSVVFALLAGGTALTMWRVAYRRV